MSIYACILPYFFLSILDRNIYDAIYLEEDCIAGDQKRLLNIGNKLLSRTMYSLNMICALNIKERQEKEQLSEEENMQVIIHLLQLKMAQQSKLSIHHTESLNTPDIKEILQMFN